MRTAPALLIASIALFTLAGCIADDDRIIPDPLPSSTPVFESDEEALAAAEEAYGAYQTQEDLISGGEVSPESIDNFATGAALESAKTGFANYATLGYRSVGSTGFEITELQQYSPYIADGLGIVTAYLCMDLSNLDVVDSGGNSVVSSGRPNFQAFELSFDLVDGSLLLSNRVPWNGEGVCAG
jgi:hypothetical protein